MRPAPRARDGISLRDAGTHLLVHGYLGVDDDRVHDALGRGEDLRFFGRAVWEWVEPRSRRARADAAWWGRLVESCVGTHLVARSAASGGSAYYWRDGDREVDYVATLGTRVSAFEVKTGRRVRASGLAAFHDAFGSAIDARVIGTDGEPLQEFLERW